MELSELERSILDEMVGLARYDRSGRPRYLRRGNPGWRPRKVVEAAFGVEAVEAAIGRHLLKLWQTFTPVNVLVRRVGEREFIRIGMRARTEWNVAITPLAAQILDVELDGEGRTPRWRRRPPELDVDGKRIHRRETVRCSSPHKTETWLDDMLPADINEEQVRRQWFADELPPERPRAQTRVEIRAKRYGKTG